MHTYTRIFASNLNPIVFFLKLCTKGISIKFPVMVIEVLRSGIEINVLFCSCIQFIVTHSMIEKACENVRKVT